MSPIRFLSRTGLGVAAAALVLPAAVAAQAPDRIELPAGWQPEGITTDGSSLFVGSLADGAIWKGDPATGAGDILVPGEDGAISAGLDVDSDSGTLWAAGGPSGQVRAFDSDSGELLGTYPFEAGFINDVAIAADAVYFTDSFMPQLLVVPLAQDGRPGAVEEAYALPISGELEYGEGFNVNGIVATEAGLIVVHSGTGELYRIDPASGDSSLIDSEGMDLTGGDGLEADGSSVYVVRNRANVVVVLGIDQTASAVSVVGELTSDDLDVPTTAAVVGDDLWAVNARFGIEVTPESEYWITRLDLGGGDA